jgi:tetratricopeptide (TPR) repeat protein
MSLAITLSFSSKDYNFILIKEVIFIISILFLLMLFFLERNIKIKKVMLYPLLLIIWFFISILFSKFKYAGVPALLITIACFIFLFLIVHSNFDETTICDIIILSFIPSMIIGVVQIFLPEKMKVFMAFGTRIPSTFGNPNFFGAYITAVLPFMIGRFLNTKNLFYRIFLIICFLISLILIFFTASKSALIAMLVGILIFFGLNYKTRIKNKILLSGIIIVFISFIVFYIFKNLDMAKESVFFRSQVWKGTLKIIFNNLITGTGLSTFSLVFPQYRPAELMKWTYEHSYEVMYPENIFLQIGSDTGITGVFLFIFIIYLIIKYGIKAPPAYLSGFAAILTTNFFGVDINYASSIFIFILISGIILKNYEDCLHISRFNLRFLIVIFVFFMIFVSSFWIKKHISGIYTKQGVYFSKTGNFKTAIENYKIALKYFDKNLEALYFLGSSYYDSGDNENALKIFKQLEKLAPDYVLLHYKIAKIYNELGLYEEAIDEYKKMLKIDPYLKEALVELAYIYYNKKNRFDEAEKIMLSAIEKYKDDSSLYSNLGNIYFMSKRLNEAIEYFKKAIAIKEDKDYYYNLGCVYFTMNDSENAKFYLKKAQNLAPSDDRIKQMLQMIERYERITGKK